MNYSPKDYHLQYDDVTMTTQDKVNIHGWFIKDKNYSKVPTILFFHGNAGSILYE